MANNGASYKILGTHYEGEIFKAAPILSPKDIKSGQPYKIPIGTFSVGFGETPKHPVDKKSGKAYFRTTGNLFEFSLEDAVKYGTFFNNDDRGMRGWLFAGEGVKPAMFNVVPYYSDWVKGHLRDAHVMKLGMADGVIETAPEKLQLIEKDTPVGLYVTHEFYLAPFNKRGVYTSKVENWRQHNLDFLFDYNEKKRGEPNPEAVAWIEHLIKERFKEPDELIGIGVGLVPKNAIAATYTFPVPYVFLVANEKFDEIITELAERYSVSGEEAFRLFKDYVIAHEIHHFYPKGQHDILGEWHLESRAGKLHEKFYKARKKIVSEEDARIYNTLEKRAGDYKKSWSSWRTILDSLFGFNLRNLNGKSLDALVSQYTSEAKAFGYDGNEISDYVSAKLREYAQGKRGLECNGKETESEKGGKKSKWNSSKKSSQRKFFSDNSKTLDSLVGGEEGEAKALVNSVYESSDESDKSESKDTKESEEGTDADSDKDGEGKGSSESRESSESND